MNSVNVVCQLAVGPAAADADLLGRFAAGRDSESFAELVRRHGPAVFAVCRRMLPTHQDAEDAFQAVFLVLARKADSVRPRERLAAWLHGVAVRTAKKVLAQTARLSHQPMADDREPGADDAEPAVAEEARILHEEIERLPEHYRTVVLLCGLRGRSRREAASELGCPEGTVAARFRRGKEELAARLKRRGITCSVAALVADLSADVARGAISPRLINETTKFGRLAALGGDVPLPDAVRSAAEGVLKTMSASHWKVTATALAALGLLFGVGQVGPKHVNADDPTPESRSIPVRDQDLLQGKWRFVSGTLDGKKADVVAAAREMTFQGSSVTLVRVPKGKGAERWVKTFQFKLDTDRKPRRMTMFGDKFLMEADYSLEGGQLRLTLEDTIRSPSGKSTVRTMVWDYERVPVTAGPVEGQPNPTRLGQVAWDDYVSGEWTLQWDDTMDGEVKAPIKSCKVRLTLVGDSLAGTFVGPVAGRERRAVIRGDVLGNQNDTLLIAFRQIERGYVCSYQFHLPASGQGRVGVWHDTRGGSGSFRLTKQGPGPIRTTTTAR